MIATKLAALRIHGLELIMSEWMLSQELINPVTGIKDQLRPCLTEPSSSGSSSPGSSSFQALAFATLLCKDFLEAEAIYSKIPSK